MRAFGQLIRLFLIRLGHYQGRLLLAMVYFLVVGPTAWVFRLFANPLPFAYAPRHKTAWKARDGAALSAQDLKEPF
ncbi:MAG: hypothetical protein HY401_06895 [Elusimicrobia bacterium]|nr:hypothetical protein [Elusimicrobiota bacterium]